VVDESLCNTGNFDALESGLMENDGHLHMNPFCA